MDKVQKTREEVERLINELIQERGKYYSSDVDDACILELQNVLTYIDSLQEEPVSSIWHDASEKADVHKGSIVAINSIGEAAAFNQGSTAILFMDDYDIERWAYVDDLLKI